MAKIPPEVRTQLEQHPWEETIPRLEFYTLRKARRLYWQGIMDGNIPSGREAADIVLEGIEDILTGKRAWTPETQYDLFAHLRSIIDSKLNKLVQSWENRYIRGEATLTVKDDNSQESSSLRAQSSNPDPSTEEIVLRAEEEKLAEDFFWGFYEYLSDEPLLQGAIECIEDDLKPAATATHLGVSPKEVYNIRKRLHRRLNDYRAQRGQMPLPRT